MAKPRPLFYEVYYSKRANGQCHWYAKAYIDGKARRKWFRDEKTAKAAAADFNRELQAYGSQIVLGPAERNMAARGIERLAEYGKTLDDAVNAYLQQLRAASQSITVQELWVACEKWLKSRLDHPDDDGGEIGWAYIKTVSKAARKFVASFGSQPIHTITPMLLRGWRDKLTATKKGADGAEIVTRASAVYKNQIMRQLHRIFSYAQRYHGLAINPVAGMEKVKGKSKKEPALLTNDQVIALLSNSDKVTLPFYALACFSGIRRAEIERLEWKDINLDKKTILIRKAKSKTNSQWTLEIQPNLIEWLRPYAGEQGWVLPRAISGRAAKLSQVSENVRKLKTKVEKAAGIDKWLQNSPRHTFMSCHLVAFQNLNYTAEQMMHTMSATSLRNYREYVEKEEALKFWRIYPDAERKAVIRPEPSPEKPQSV
jgi:integrase